MFFVSHIRFVLDNNSTLSRICPGRHLADVSLFLAISTILALYNVKKGVGPDGKEITPEVGTVSGLTRSVALSKFTL